MNVSSSPTPANATALLLQLAKEPWSLGFYQAMRRLESLYPAMPRWGEARRPIDEPLRLGQSTDLGFAASQIGKFFPATDTQPARIDLLFFGVLGAQGPMPIAFSEYVRDRERRNDDPTSKAFLDLYHHRLACLLYRSWASGRPAIELDRTPPRSSDFARKVTAASGQASRLMRLPDGIARYAAAYSAANRSAEGLRAVLTSDLRTQVRLNEFVGRWLRVARGERTRLVTPTIPSTSPATGQQRRSMRHVTFGLVPTRLGRAAVLGERVFDARQRFGIRLGPMSWRRFARLLPVWDSRSLTSRVSRTSRRLFTLVREYVEPGVDFDVRLVLRGTDVPAPVLGRRSPPLGQGTWLPHHPHHSDHARRAERDRADFVLRPTPVAAPVTAPSFSSDRFASNRVSNRHG